MTIHCVIATGPKGKQQPLPWARRITGSDGTTQELVR
jgi:hypothetical protein